MSWCEVERGLCQGILVECREVSCAVWAGPSSSVGIGSVGDSHLVLSYQRVVEPVEAVNVAHHASGAVNKCEVVTEQFLCDAADLVDVAQVVEEFLQGTAITHPVEVGSRDVLSVLSDGPPSCDGFPDEGVKMLFALSAPMGPKADGSQASSGHEFIESVWSSIG